MDVKLTEKQIAQLVEAALDARKKAYIPYSNHGVGAALLASDGTVFKGCNIENGAFSPTICAERTAFAKAVSEGFREYTAIAIAGGLNEVPEKYCAPCGVCRQVMAEFCEPDFLVIMAKTPQDYKLIELKDLLPLSFKL